MWCKVQLMDPIKVAKIIGKRQWEFTAEVSEVEVKVEYGRGTVKIKPHVEIVDRQNYRAGRFDLRITDDDVPCVKMSKLKCEKLSPETQKLLKGIFRRTDYVYLSLPDEFRETYEKVKQAEKEITDFLRAACQRWLEEKGPGSKIPVKMWTEPRYAFFHIQAEGEEQENLKEELLVCGTGELSPTAEAILSALPGKVFAEFLEHYMRDRLMDKDTIRKVVDRFEGRPEYSRSYEWDYGTKEEVSTLLSAALAVCSEVRMEKLQKRLEELEGELEKLRGKVPELEEYFREKYVGSVHVTEDGYFSDCPPFCDDCFWNPHYTREALERFPEIRKKAERFYVSSRKGKTYTYYIPDSSLTKEILEKYEDELRKEMQEVYGRDVSLREEKADELKRELRFLEKLSGSSPEEEVGIEPLSP